MYILRKFKKYICIYIYYDEKIVEKIKFFFLSLSLCMSANEAYISFIIIL